MKTLIKLTSLLLFVFCTNSHAGEPEPIGHCSFPLIVNKSLTEFSGDTLILGCGHMDVENGLSSSGEYMYASHKHEDHYTIDLRSEINPDLVGSFTDPETHAYLLKHGKGKFKRIILEHTDFIFSYDECLLTLINELLTPGGVVIFDVASHNDDLREFWDYWVIDEFEYTEQDPCYLSLHLQMKYITDYPSYYLYMGNFLRSIGFSTIYLLEESTSDLRKIDALKDTELGPTNSYNLIVAYREE